MQRKRKTKTKQSKEPFHKRFNVDIGEEEARRRFVNRVKNQLFNTFFCHKELTNKKRFITSGIANKLGEEYKPHTDLNDYIKDDFFLCMQALEEIYSWLEDEDIDRKGFGLSDAFDMLLRHIIERSEIDLGVTWSNGHFTPSGAKELDEALVNAPLKWMQKMEYEAVLKPYSKALQHYLGSLKRPELISDVVTDLYESIEALAKIVTGRKTRDLSANKDLFINKVNVSEEYKWIMKKYIDYANKFRHASHTDKGKPKTSRKEVEAFLYLTGVFIRLAMYPDEPK